MLYRPRSARDLVEMEHRVRGFAIYKNEVGSVCHLAGEKPSRGALLRHLYESVPSGVAVLGIVLPFDSDASTRRANPLINQFTQVGAMQ